MTNTGRVKAKQPFDGTVGCPRGFPAACLLLLLSESRCHGYELANRLRRFGVHIPDLSPLYAQLRDFENAELVYSELGAPGKGPPPKLYGLTPQGQEALERCEKNIGTVIGQLEDFLAAIGR